MSKPMRDDAIQLIDQAIQGSDFKCSKIFLPHIATVLWLYQMGILLFLANDTSENQEKTEELLKLSLSMLIKLLKLSTIPLLSPVNKAFGKVAEIVISTFEGVSHEALSDEGV